MRRIKLLFYVQHLLGIGHLRRAAVLARALAAANIDVLFISGGDVVPGIDAGRARFSQLPPCHTDNIDFKTLLDPLGHPVTDAWKNHRRDLLLAHFQSFQPDVLIFELFPFGRRQMRFELIPLLQAVMATRPKPLVIASVRDILVAQKKPERNAEMVDLAKRYFDHILVHGDPGFIPFEATFPPAHEVAAKIHYTGYVVDPVGVPVEAPGLHGLQGAGEILVSGGGGAVSGQLLVTALAAKPLSRARDLPWRILLGVNLPKAEGDMIRRQAAALGGIVVEAARPDFPALLHRARLSISQGGYNTVLESLAVQARSLVVPYAGGLETEQTLRCRMLADRGFLTMLEEKDLRPETLAQAIDHAMDHRPPPQLPVDVGGAEKTVRLISAWLT